MSIGHWVFQLLHFTAFLSSSFFFFFSNKIWWIQLVESFPLVSSHFLSSVRYFQHHLVTVSVIQRNSPQSGNFATIQLNENYPLKTVIWRFIATCSCKLLSFIAVAAATNRRIYKFNVAGRHKFILLAQPVRASVRVTLKQPGNSVTTFQS